MNKAGQNMTVTILGSGTCVPSLNRGASSLLVQVGDKRLLVDIGTGTMRRLLEAGFSIYDIDYLLITHFHPDHTGELASFLFALKCMGPDLRKTPLVLAGGPGFVLFYEQLKLLYQHWVHLSDKLNIVELRGDGRDRPEIATGDFVLSCARVEHRPESLAYRIETPEGASVVVSGDTDYAANLVHLARETDLFVCEAAFPDEFRAEGHLTPSGAGRLASEANVKGLVLTHFYPECDEADMYGQCRNTYSGPLVLAEDLMKINVNAG